MEYKRQQKNKLKAYQERYHSEEFVDKRLSNVLACKPELIQVTTPDYNRTLYSLPKLAMTDRKEEYEETAINERKIMIMKMKEAVQ